MPNTAQPHKVSEADGGLKQARLELNKRSTAYVMLCIVAALAASVNYHNEHAESNIRDKLVQAAFQPFTENADALCGCLM